MKTHSNTDIVRICSSNKFIDIADLVRYKSLFYYILWKDFSVKYKQTIFGFIWLFLQPLGLMILMTLFFNRVARLPSDGLPYPVFVLAALVPWRFFASSLATASTSVIRSSSLLKQVYIPRLYFPVAGVASCILTAIAAFIILMAVMVYYDMPFSIKLLLIPVILTHTALLALSISLFLSSLNTIVRDIGHALPIVLQGWMYSSPIVYPLSLVPDEYKSIYILNPMVGIVETFRWCLSGAAEFPLASVYSSAIACIFMLAFGLWVFGKYEKTFIDVI